MSALTTDQDKNLESRFWEHIKAMPNGEKIKLCIQCGTCGGSCPVVSWMDYSPRKLFALIRAGQIQEAVSSNTSWICASCYLCAVRCPKDIKITDVMYALKRFSIQEDMVSKDTTGNILVQTFANMIKKYGRNAEAEMLTTYFLNINPVGLLGVSGLGTALFLHGRMGLLPHKIKGKRQLDAIIKKVESMETVNS